MRMSHIWAACLSSCQSLACIPGSAPLPLQTKPFPAIQTKAHLYSSPETVNWTLLGLLCMKRPFPGMWVICTLRLSFSRVHLSPSVFKPSRPHHRSLFVK